MTHDRSPQAEDGPRRRRDHPDGAMVLTLGLMSLVLVPPMAPFAWAKGNRALRQIDARPGTYTNRRSVQVGRIVGIVVTCAWSVALLVGAVVVAGDLLTADDDPGPTAEPTTTLDPETELRACRTDTRTLVTATQAWNATYLQGGSSLPTPWPRSDEELVFASLLEVESPHHELNGDGASPPTITKLPGRCAGEELLQPG